MKTNRRALLSLGVGFLGGMTTKASGAVDKVVDGATGGLTGTAKEAVGSAALLTWLKDTYETYKENVQDPFNKTIGTFNDVMSTAEKSRNFIQTLSQLEAKILQQKEQLKNYFTNFATMRGNDLLTLRLSKFYIENQVMFRWVQSKYNEANNLIKSIENKYQNYSPKDKKTVLNKNHTYRAAKRFKTVSKAHMRASLIAAGLEEKIHKTAEKLDKNKALDNDEKVKAFNESISVSQAKVAAETLKQANITNALLLEIVTELTGQNKPEINRLNLFIDESEMPPQTSKFKAKSFKEWATDIREGRPEDSYKGG